MSQSVHLEPIMEVSIASLLVDSLLPKLALCWSDYAKQVNLTRERQLSIATRVAIEAAYEALRGVDVEGIMVRRIFASILLGANQHSITQKFERCNRTQLALPSDRDARMYILERALYSHALLDEHRKR